MGKKKGICIAENLCHLPTTETVEEQNWREGSGVVNLGLPGKRLLNGSCGVFFLIKFFTAMNTGRPSHIGH